jgi:hypothetical protein
LSSLPLLLLLLPLLLLRPALHPSWLVAGAAPVRSGWETWRLRHRLARWRPLLYYTNKGRRGGREGGKGRENRDGVSNIAISGGLLRESFEERKDRETL